MSVGSQRRSVHFEVRTRHLRHRDAGPQKRQRVRNRLFLVGKDDRQRHDGVVALIKVFDGVPDVAPSTDAKPD